MGQDGNEGEDDEEDEEEGDGARCTNETTTKSARVPLIGKWSDSHLREVYQTHHRKTFTQIIMARTILDLVLIYQRGMVCELAPYLGCPCPKVSSPL